MKLFKKVAAGVSGLMLAPAVFAQTGPDLTPLTAAIDFGSLETDVIAGFAAVVVLTVLIAACTILWRVAKGAKGS